MKGPVVDRVDARALTIPTETPEADGTLEWTSTTVVLAEVAAGGLTGLGYSYAAAAAVSVISETLGGVLTGRDAFDVEAAWNAMLRQVRNIGRPGVAACAISALDTALWDLKAKALGLPLCRLLGQAREAVPVYGSGGFTNYDDHRLRDQLGGWVRDGGCGAVKMKVGADPAADPRRMALAREAIGETAELMIDANGALDAKGAVGMALEAADLGVVWFEEPVSSDDLDGLAFVRAQAPPPIKVAAGEYGYDPWYFARMLGEGAVDALQADATRCLGVTGFLKAATLAQAAHTPFSAHCAPTLHLHPACAAPGLLHVEWFFDHARIEPMLFDGAPVLRDGAIRPDLTRPGLGLELKRADAERFAA